MTWLDSLHMELENIDGKLIEPTGEVQPNEHAVGTADTDVRKLYGLAMQWDKTAMETLVAARYVNSRADQESAAETASVLHKKSQILMDIFWASLKDSFDLWQKPSIGVRAGWKVVWSEPEVPNLGDVLGRLFGNL